MDIFHRGKRREEKHEEIHEIVFPDFLFPSGGDPPDDPLCGDPQRHVHEFQGSVVLALEDNLRHNHRFAGVSGQADKDGRSHTHEITARTDFFGHFHEINTRSGPAVLLGDGKHVHNVAGRTSENDRHRHQFTLATLIEAPLYEDRG